MGRSGGRSTSRFTPPGIDILWPRVELTWSADQLADLPPSVNILWPRVELTWADQAADQLADLPPIDLPLHRFLLWELIYSRVQMGFHSAPADHLTLHLQIYPLKMAIWDSYWQIPTLTAQANQVADHTDGFLLWKFRQIKWHTYPPFWHLMEWN